MAAEHTCCALVKNYAYNLLPCGKKAKTQYKGEWFCGIHGPVRRKARRDKQSAIETAKYEARRKMHEHNHAVSKAKEAVVDAAKDASAHLFRSTAFNLKLIEALTALKKLEGA